MKIRNTKHPLRAFLKHIENKAAQPIVEIRYNKRTATNVSGKLAGLGNYICENSDFYCNAFIVYT